MYKAYFNLKSAPFKLTPDIHCFFSEGNRKAILDALLYAIKDGVGLIKVVGEVGSGKTLLSRVLAQSLPSSYEILYLLNPRIPADKILYAIALELALGTHYPIDKVSLLHLLHNKLLQLHQQGRQTVLLIDEAQAIPIESLEEIRMLTNLETGSNKLLQIVLFGQPELDQHLNRHEVRQIGERIVHSFYLPRLNSAEVGRYLDFRLQHAGYQGTFLFSGTAVKIITWKADGFLRRINILAEKCLLTAFAQQSRQVNGWTALQVALGARFRLVKMALLLLFVASGISLYVGLAGHQSLMPKSASDASIASIAPVVSDDLQQAQVQQTHSSAQARLSGTSFANSGDGYSIQLIHLKADNQDSLQRKIKKLMPDYLQPQVFVHANGVNAYQVFLGRFASYEEAERLLQQLPEAIKNNKPFIVKQSVITKKYNELAINLKN